MNSQLALQTSSLLPASLSRVLTVPSSSELEKLHWRYKKEAQTLSKTHALLSSPESQRAVSLLLCSSMGDNANVISGSIASACLDKSHQILQQRYWRAAIDLTDVLVHMPTNRKKEWETAIEKYDFPAFTLENLYSTLSTLLNERDKFVAERVDGIFKSLSGEHITNSPSGFNRRFILAKIHDGYTPSERVCGYVNDLRIVIGTFMGRDPKSRVNTYQLINTLMDYRTGEWVELDGGSIRIRVYKKGTAHFEVHEDLAWRLNEVLAILYPRAIPSEFRTKKNNSKKTFHLSQQLIGFDVALTFNKIKPVHDICEKTQRSRGKKPLTYSFDGAYGMDKHFVRRCTLVMNALGGVELLSGEFTFDYDPTDTFKEVALTGSVPDQVSHQYYPTPEPIVIKMVNKLGSLSGSRILEPSAGQGAIAKHLKGQLTLVEISKLHCEILRKKALGEVVNADFVEYAQQAKQVGTEFNAIVMNPPFSQGRATLHLEKALSLLSRHGTLIALVTQSVAHKFNPEGYVKSIEYIMPNEFAGVSVSLCIIQLDSLKCD